MQIPQAHIPDQLNQTVRWWELEMYFYKVQRRFLSPLKYENPTLKFGALRNPGLSWLIILKFLSVLKNFG